jgi:serine phosphatase RsbU (regulator of sigma subunit)
VMIFYTDGIPECFNPDQRTYGLERLQEVIDSQAAEMNARQLETAIITDLLQFADNHPAEDDVTLAILHVR